MSDLADQCGEMVRVESVHFQRPTGIPNGWDADLLRLGVLRARFGPFRPADRLTLLKIPDRGPFVAFGSSGPHDAMCLDPRSGAIVLIVMSARGGSMDSPVYLGAPTFVNTSLQQFNASVRAVVKRRPYDSWIAGNEPLDSEAEAEAEDRLFDEWDRASQDMVESLRAIDPPAVADLSGFWMRYVADVQMGIYATKNILGNGQM